MEELAKKSGWRRTLPVWRNSRPAVRKLRVFPWGGSRWLLLDAVLGGVGSRNGGAPSALMHLPLMVTVNQRGKPVRGLLAASPQDWEPLVSRVAFLTETLPPHSIPSSLVSVLLLEIMKLSCSITLTAYVSSSFPHDALSHFPKTCLAPELFVARLEIPLGRDGLSAVREASQFLFF